MRLFPIIKKTVTAVVIGVTNFVVKPRAAMRLSLVATTIAGTARVAVRFAFAPLRAVAGIARPGLGLSTVSAGSVLTSSRPALRLANASSGTPARPLERPAPRFTRHWVNLTHRSGATAVAEEAVATRTDWANDANATAKRDGASASMAGNALGARGGRLVLSFADFPNKAPLAISAVRLHFYVGSSLVGVTDQMVLGWRKGGGTIVLETIPGTTIISNLTTPRTHDITGSITGWADLDALQAIVEASTAVASLNSYSCDAVELEVVASRIDNL